jgi:hypothetical protein
MSCDRDSLPGRAQFHCTPDKGWGSGRSCSIRFAVLNTRIVPPFQAWVWRLCEGAETHTDWCGPQI